jgi:hypothetical protein
MKKTLCLIIILFSNGLLAINTYPPDGSSDITAGDLETTPPPQYPPAKINPLDVIKLKEMQKNQNKSDQPDDQIVDAAIDNSQPTNPQLVPQETPMPEPSSE